MNVSSRKTDRISMTMVIGGECPPHKALYVEFKFFVCRLIGQSLLLVIFEAYIKLCEVSKTILITENQYVA
jgi:hypothetical protein